MEAIKRSSEIEATRDEYLTILVDAIANPVLDTLQKLLIVSDGGEKWIKFQRRLQACHHWNTLKIREEVEKITLRCPHIRKLITAVMYSFVRLMTSMHNSTPPINLEVPTTEKFVHTVFDNTAEYFYGNLSAWKDVDQRRMIVTRIIIRTVKKFLPMEDILQAYLGSGKEEGEEEESVLEEPLVSEFPMMTPAPSLPAASMPYSTEEAVAAVPVNPILPANPVLPANPAVEVNPVPAPVTEIAPPTSPDPKPMTAPAPEDFFSDADDEL